MALTTHPHLAPMLKKGYGYTSTTPPPPSPRGLRVLFYGELYNVSKDRSYFFRVKQLALVPYPQCRKGATL